MNVLKSTTTYEGGSMKVDFFFFDKIIHYNFTNYAYGPTYESKI